MAPVRAQTIKQAKVAYKKNSNASRLSETEQRQLERAVLLQERADKERERETKRRVAQKKRSEKDEKERATRRQLGIGLATQMAGYSHTQKQMKGVMECFVKAGKKEAEEQQPKAKGATVTEAPVDAPPDEDDIDALLLQELADAAKLEITPEAAKPLRTSQSFGHSIDDDTLLEAGSLFEETARRSCPEPSQSRKRSFSEVAQDTTGLEGITAAGMSPSRPFCRSSSSGSGKRQRTFGAMESKKRQEDRIPCKACVVPVDDWASFLTSDTQIAHELTPPKIVSSKTLLDPVYLSISTQDLRYSDDEDDDKDPAEQIVDGNESVDDSTPAVNVCNESRGVMQPPPRPPRHVNPGQTNQQRHPKSLNCPAVQSTFHEFGLNTQIVQAFVDDIDLTDEEDETPGPNGHKPPALINDTFDWSDSDTFGSEADFG